MKTEAYFEMTAAAADHRIRRPMSDLKVIEADLDEIAARAHTPTTTAVIDHDGIWAKTNGTTKAALVARKASSKSLDVDAVWRRYNNGGPDPSKVMEK